MGVGVFARPVVVRGWARRPAVAMPASFSSASDGVGGDRTVTAGEDNQALSGGGWEFSEGAPLGCPDVSRGSFCSLPGEGRGGMEPLSGVGVEGEDRGEGGGSCTVLHSKELVGVEEVEAREDGEDEEDEEVVVVVARKRTERRDSVTDVIVKGAMNIHIYRAVYCMENQYLLEL